MNINFYTLKILNLSKENAEFFIQIVADPSLIFVIFTVTFDFCIKSPFISEYYVLISLLQAI